MALLPLILLLVLLLPALFFVARLVLDQSGKRDQKPPPAKIYPAGGGLADAQAPVCEWQLEGNGPPPVRQVDRNGLAQVEQPHFPAAVRGTVLNLIEALKADAWPMRLHAAQQLGRLGCLALPAIPALGERARWDPVRLVRQAALKGLLQIREACRQGGLAAADPDSSGPPVEEAATAVEKPAPDTELNPNWKLAILIGNLTLAGAVAVTFGLSYLAVLIAQHVLLMLVGIALLVCRIQPIGWLVLGIGGGVLLPVALFPLFWSYVLGL